MQDGSGIGIHERILCTRRPGGKVAVGALPRTERDMHIEGRRRICLCALFPDAALTHGLGLLLGSWHLPPR